MHKGFGFKEVLALLDYLGQLGISDIYLSPILQARPGSTHGYDICDHGSLNSELGTEEDFEALHEGLVRRGMGLLMDFVPNHMAADAALNPWWRDLLENGPCSPFARFFDVDWNPLKSELKSRILLPVLGDHYGRVLERGELRIAFEDGVLVLRYFDQAFPLNPQPCAKVYSFKLKPLQQEMGESDPKLRELLSVLTALRNLPPTTETDASKIEERHREKEIARNRLRRLVQESPRILAYIGDCVGEYNGDASQPERIARLHELLEAQAYRLSYWKTADHEINYRRFFDVSGLVALRMEEDEVFEATHRKILKMAAEGKITGLRLDHVDGLFDPLKYLTHLQQALAKDQPNGGPTPFYLLVEKILTGNEKFPDDWPAAGTTGYDFIARVGGLFRNPDKKTGVLKNLADFTGDSTPFSQVAYQSKKLIMDTSLAGELNVLANQLNRLSEQDPRTRDFTLAALRTGLREVIACFPAYRTYVGPDGWTDQDRQLLLEAIGEANGRNPAADPGLYEFLQSILLPDANSLSPTAFQAALHFTMKFQQYTGPVKAKGVEDTAFYRYLPLLSLNEVGSDPGHYDCDIAEFHRFNLERKAKWPHTLNATATHDTKRGEDARCRLNLLSEVPEEWADQVAKLSGFSGSHQGQVKGKLVPDKDEQYLFYQALFSAWPCGFEATDFSLLGDRLSAYFVKALREAKNHTSWINPNESYEKAATGFVRQMFGEKERAQWSAALLPFIRRTASQGCLQSLSQLLLKITSPGIPDFYEGNELWDFALVDPDNRHPVDFDLRKTLLKEVAEALESAGGPGGFGRPLGKIREWLARWEDGTIKLYVTLAALGFRRRLPELFLEGDYLPLEVSGQAASHLVAFARRQGRQTAIVAVPRLTAEAADPGSAFPPMPKNWGDTSILLPSGIGSSDFLNVFTGETSLLPTGDPSRLGASELFKNFPLALLSGPKT
jgi:(1->4)-alpha-D-glucan 1-alpha-D-glucosylmutase